jgi:hypothetical protein
MTSEVQGLYPADPIQYDDPVTDEHMQVAGEVQLALLVHGTVDELTLTQNCAVEFPPQTNPDPQAKAVHGPPAD